MTEPVTITIPGEPQGKGRARAFITRGGKVGHYTPGKTRTYEGIVATLAMEAMKGRSPIEGPVRIDLTALFTIPASWPRARRERALANLELPGKRPDLDNIAKAVTDGLNAVVVRDDAQIVSAHLAKRYGIEPMVVVTVRPLDG